jgi:hypothetical protein
MISTKYSIIVKLSGASAIFYLMAKIAKHKWGLSKTFMVDSQIKMKPGDTVAQANTFKVTSSPW